MTGKTVVVGERIYTLIGDNQIDCNPPCFIREGDKLLTVPGCRNHNILNVAGVGDVCGNVSSPSSGSEKPGKRTDLINEKRLCRRALGQVVENVEEIG